MLNTTSYSGKITYDDFIEFMDKIATRKLGEPYFEIHSEQGWLQHPTRRFTELELLNHDIRYFLGNRDGIDCYLEPKLR